MVEHRHRGAAGLDALDHALAPLVHAAEEQQIDGPLLQGRGLGGCLFKIGRMPERDQRHVGRVGTVGTHVGQVVVHHAGGLEQLEVFLGHLRAAWAELFQVDEQAGVAFAQFGVEPQMGAEDKIDGVFAQAVLGHGHLHPEAPKLMPNEARRVQEGQGMHVARWLHDAQVDGGKCQVAVHGAGLVW